MKRQRFSNPLVGAKLSVSTRDLAALAGAAARLRGEGWRTLAALSDDEDPRALGCTHRLESGEAILL